MDKHIDVHAHCRDGKQAYKATIKSVTELARKQDIVAVGDMPNTIPPIQTSRDVEARIRLAEEEGCLDGYYLWVGMPNDPSRVGDAVEAAVSNDERVLGIKMFAGKSVGSLSMTKPENQKAVFKELARLDFDGVIALHCEKEELFHMELWNPDKPRSWNDARPQVAEVESIKDLISFAEEVEFAGTLHICHITSPEAVKVVDDARKNLSITCGATPHHLTISTKMMDGHGGLMYKVNPPIRDDDTVQGLVELLRQGKIDWIETDHAPHTLEEKLNYPYMSGIQSLTGYKWFLARLRSDGFSNSQIDALTYSNIKRVFRNIRE